MKCRCDDEAAAPAAPGRVLAYSPVAHVLGKARQVARAQGATLAESSEDLDVLLFPDGTWPRFLQALAEGTSQAERRDLRLAEAADGIGGLALARLALGARTADEWCEALQVGWIYDLFRERRVLSHFQPIVDVTAGTVFAHEALLRGRTVDGATIAAGQLLEAARGVHQLFQLDQLGRDSAIRCAARQGLADRTVFVNFIPTVIYDPANCLQTTMRALAETGRRPEHVVFEVVESEHVEQRADLLRILDYYRAQGFRVALDDLGAGYASLNLLGALRPDFIKLDMELVRAAPGNPLQSGLVEAFVQFAARFDIQVIAEGVEDAAAADYLQDLGVRLMQGYYFGRPAETPALDTAALTAQHARARVGPPEIARRPSLLSNLEG